MSSSGPVRLSRAPPSRPPPVTRVHLTNAQKLELCEYSAAHPALAWDELAVWAKKRFRLKKPVATTTVYRALRQYDALRQMTPRELEARCLRRDTVFSQFETWLRDWIVQMADRGLRLDCKIIQAEAQRLRAELDDRGALAKLAKLAKLAFSNGWLASFMLRHDLSLTELHKGGSVVAPNRPRRVNKKRATATPAPAAPVYPTY